MNPIEAIEKTQTISIIKNVVKKKGRFWIKFHDGISTDLICNISDGINIISHLIHVGEMETKRNYDISKINKITRWKSIIYDLVV